MVYFAPLRAALLLAGLGLGFAAQGDVATTIARVKPSVVILGSYKSTNSPRFTLRGTGFVVGMDARPLSNWVITNAHVLQYPDDGDVLTDLVIQIKPSSGDLQMRNATVVGVDTQHDLALLHFDGPSAPGLTVRDSSWVQEGQSVAFTGFPIGGALGFSPVTHRGMVSSIVAAALPTPNARQLNEKTVRGLRSGSFDIFQLDATAYPGNSGGPLFDPETGEVLGVLNMVFIKGTRESALTNPSGISYAIPSSFVLQLLQGMKPLPP